MSHQSRPAPKVRVPMSFLFRRTVFALVASAASFPALAQTPPVAQTVTAPVSILPDTMTAPATPPTVVPTLPVAPPIPLPVLTAAQEDMLTRWLGSGADQGIGSASRATALTGEPLVRAVLDRARALHSGRIDNSDFLDIWALRPAAYDPLPTFAQAVAADRIAQWSAALTPPYAGYEGLRKGLATYARIAASGGWPTLSAASGGSAIRARLRIEDPAVTPDESLVDALQRAQRRYGLNPTGNPDARTLAALNVPVASRIAAIKANLERWRWMPRDLPVNRVQVNIAAAVLTMFEGDAPITSMRAVTGRPGGAETPMLQSRIHSIVINPPWNVPSSIAKKELWPKGRAALIAQGYKIVGTPETGERIVQPAGPGSALGRLKFDFDNPFAVYLHDTPARAKFASFDRLASHGCVRLEKPRPLARMMLEDDPKWTGTAVDDAIDTGKTQRVALPQKVAVYLLYWTAFASGNGTMNFREDPYNWDSLLAQKIDASARRAQTLVTASRN